MSVVQCASRSEASPVIEEEERSYEWPVPERIVSLPPEPTQSKELIKQQFSAPSYWQSLAANDAAPFRKPGREPVPTILVGLIVTEQDVIEMVAAHESDPKNGMKTFLSQMVVRHNITQNYNISERNFLTNLLVEVVNYCAQRDFNTHKLSTMLTIYLAAHLYFKWYYWSSPSVLWQYFKDIMVKHTIPDSPVGAEVFSAEESYDILTHFHTAYMNNLPLIHILTFCSSRLKFVWPFSKAVAKK